MDAERIRFVRGLYQLWSLVLLNPVARQQIMGILKLRDGFDDTMIYDKAVMAKQEVDVGLLATVFMELYPFKMRVIENVFHDSSVRHAPFDMGYRGIVSIWNSHYEDFKQLTTWLRGDDGPMSPISEIWYDTSDGVILLAILLFCFLFRSPFPAGFIYNWPMMRNMSVKG